MYHDHDEGHSKSIKGLMFEKTITTKEFFAKIKQRLVKNENTEIGTPLTSLISRRYMGKGNIREYIMEMSHLTSK